MMRRLLPVLTLLIGLSIGAVACGGPASPSVGDSTYAYSGLTCNWSPR